MKLWRPKQAGSRQKLNPPARHTQPSLSLYVSAAVCACRGKTKRAGRHRSPSEPEQGVRACPARRSRSLWQCWKHGRCGSPHRHTAQHTPDARVGTKGEGEEGTRDGAMRWFFSCQGCPDPQLLQCPTAHWEKGCGGLGKVTVT